MSDPEDRDARADSDDEEDESDDEDDVGNGIKEAVSEMKKIFVRKASDEDVNRFIKKHNWAVLNPPTAGDNFLHRIITTVQETSSTSFDVVTASNIKPLVEAVVNRRPDFLRLQNEERQTPIYRAIQVKKNSIWKLVGYMLNSCPESQIIEDALKMTPGNDTCMTLAFSKDLNARVLRNLVERASDDVLALRDNSRKTPFHYAVEYEQCSDERVGVIELLLKKDEEAVERLRASGTRQEVETFLDCPDPNQRDQKEPKDSSSQISHSVYGEHQRTRRVYEAKKRERETKTAEAEQERTDGKVSGTSHAIREKDPIKTKDPKSQVSGDRDRLSKRNDRDLERTKADNEKLDENELKRQELKREQERRAQEEKKQQQRTQNAEGDIHRSKQPREHREKANEAPKDIPKIQISQVGPDHAPNTPLKRASTQRFDDVEEKKKRDKKPAPAKKASRKPPSDVLERNSARVLWMLKLHYMRTRGLKSATNFLYGKNVQDIQICFDYDGLPSQIEDHVFLNRFGEDHKSGIRFDEVLMHVKFPNVTVTRTGRNAQKGSRALGRQDMEFFFGWLYKKGVRRILKVEVDDVGKVPHSDQSIQNSLEKIVVEHLDWQKTDMDPRTICRVGSKARGPNYAGVDSKNGATEAKSELREVTLRWSGSNAVLRAWSEAEGLPRLPNLRRISLIIPPYSDLFDTGDWVESNLTEFDIRVNQHVRESQKAKTTTENSTPKAEEAPSTSPPSRQIEVKFLKGKKGTEIPVTYSGLPRAAGKLNPITEHEWLRCMEKFARAMHQFWRDTLERMPGQPGAVPNETSKLFTADTPNWLDLQKLKKDVVIALIDDGVDSCDPDFFGRAIEGKTFDYQDNGVGQYYISANGHGTDMARMIWKVCPMASIYSIRLKTHTDPKLGTSTIDPASAAAAIEAALEKGATIISMSWTIPVPDDGSEGKRQLDAVLARACERQNPVMFCSSSDNIANNAHYPSGFNRDRFFVIGAAHDDGSGYGQAGKRNDFIFPGVNVNTRGSSLPAYLTDKTSSIKESTGSSIATALAAGLAAMITYCFKASALDAVAARRQQGVDTGPELISPDHVTKLADHDTLKMAFDRLGKSEDGHFIEVWRRFEPATKILDADDKTYEEKIARIKNLCSNLMERW